MTKAATERKMKKYFQDNPEIQEKIEEIQNLRKSGHHKKASIISNQLFMELRLHFPNLRNDAKHAFLNKVI